MHDKRCTNAKMGNVNVSRSVCKILKGCFFFYHFILHYFFSGAEGIILALKKSELPCELPPLQSVKSPVPDITLSILEDKASVLHVLKSDLNVVRDYAK